MTQHSRALAAILAREICRGTLKRWPGLFDLAQKEINMSNSGQPAGSRFNHEAQPSTKEVFATGDPTSGPITHGASMKEAVGSSTTDGMTVNSQVAVKMPDTSVVTGDRGNGAPWVTGLDADVVMPNNPAPREASPAGPNRL
jgi:hypothetical protein